MKILWILGRSYAISLIVVFLTFFTIGYVTTKIKNN